MNIPGWQKELLASATSDTEKLCSDFIIIVAQQGV